jgi:glycerol-3-phosphate acyltransferase PlsY
MREKEINPKRLLIFCITLSTLVYSVIFINQKDGPGLWTSAGGVLVLAPITGLILAVVWMGVIQIGKLIKGWLHNDY